MLTYILVFLCVVITLIIKNRNSDYWKKKNIVQVDGTIWQFMFGDRSLPEIFKEIYDQHTEDHIGIFMGSQPALILKNLEDVQAVLAGNFQSFHSRGIVINPNDVLADNILFIDDFKRWKILRHKLSPVFTSMRLKTMFCIIEKCARDFVKLVENDKKIREKLFDGLYTYAATSIGASVFGIDTRRKNTMDSPFLDMAWKSVEPSFKTNVKFFISNTSPRLFKLLNLKIFGEHEEFFVGAVKNVFKNRRNEEQRYDFIDVCLEIQKNGVMKDNITGYELEPTDEILAAQAFFFFIAGVDTTGNAMHFTLLELSSNPKALLKLHDEIDNVFKEGKQEITFDDLEKLKYLDMVINEAMRKYPPIGAIQRICTKDTVLPSNNLNIERNTVVVIPIFGIHRDDRFYPDPESFKPERFAPNNAKEVKKLSYLAFGEGNRICLGARFARIQMKAGLAWLLRRFTLAEQSYQPKKFGRSPFGLRDVDARYELIARDL